MTGTANLVFPAAVLTWQRVSGPLSMGACAKLLAVVAAGTLTSKVLLEGRGTYPSYGRHGKRAAGAKPCRSLCMPRSGPPMLAGEGVQKASKPRSVRLPEHHAL